MCISLEYGLCNEGREKDGLKIKRIIYSYKLIIAKRINYSYNLLVGLSTLKSLFGRYHHGLFQLQHVPQPPIVSEPRALM